MQRCLEICRRHDVLYISDEVVTAFGRLGHWFASKDVFGIEPDLITCAKGLTSGYLPLGACLISDRLMAEITGEDHENVLFANGYTYSGHPVCCAAALENIRIIEAEGLLEHVRAIAPHFNERLHALRRARRSSATRAASAWSAASRAGLAAPATGSRAIWSSPARSIPSARSAA